jgi:periplasmic protein TonB
MSAYIHDSGYNQRRTMVLFAIIVLHLFIGWAFVSGFGKAAIAKLTKDVQVSLIKEDQPKELPPPPPKPDLLPPPPVSVPPPLVNINIPVEAPPIVTTSKPPPPPAPHVSVVASTQIQTVRLPDCHEDYYPSQALRLQQEGSVTVKFCVGADNKLDGALEVLTSSGFPVLDEAAGKCLAAGRFKAATVEGKPVRSCKPIKITYKLKQ